MEDRKKATVEIRENGEQGLGERQAVRLTSLTRKHFDKKDCKIIIIRLLTNWFSNN